MKQIFLVEDDTAIAKNLTRLLRTEGFAVTLASTQAEAFTLLDGKRFDLALIDISLPDGNGFRDQGDAEDSGHLSDGYRRRGQCGHRAEHGGGRLCHKTLPASGTDCKDQGCPAQIRPVVCSV